MVRWGSPVRIRSRAQKAEVPGRHQYRINGSICMASKKKGPVEKIALQCTECKRRNYTTTKNRRNIQGKLEFNKYCKFDRKHTLHRETKIK